MAVFLIQNMRQAYLTLTANEAWRLHMDVCMARLMGQSS